MTLPAAVGADATHLGDPWEKNAVNDTTVRPLPGTAAAS